MGGSSAGVFAAAAAAPSTSMGTDSSLTGAAGLEYTSYCIGVIIVEDNADYVTKINVLGRKKREKLILRRRCRVEDEQTVKNLKRFRYFRQQGPTV